MKRTLQVAVAAVFVLLVLWIATSGGRLLSGSLDNRILGRQVDSGQFSIEILSSPYELDRVYKSMMGPRSNHGGIRLVEDLADNETLWLTGIRTRVVDADKFEPVSNEFFCHSNLTLSPETSSPEQHNRSFDHSTHADWRLFTLIPGRTSIQLPDGFGVPIKNETHVDYFSMTLSQNPGYPPRSVRVRTEITGRHGVTDAGAIKPLFRRALYIYQQHVPTAQQAVATITDGHATEHQGALCAEDCKQMQLGETASWSAKVAGSGGPVHPGATCCVANASQDGIVQRFGEQNTVHWMVPPGQHVYRTEVTEQMLLPSDTSIHYVTAHLHPFGKYLRLVDLEADKVVCEILSESFDDRLGVAHMSEITSREGIPLHRGRRYELIAEYDNRLDQPIDAMAILYFYAATPSKKTAKTLAARATIE